MKIVMMSADSYDTVFTLQQYVSGAVEKWLHGMAH